MLPTLYKGVKTHDDNFATQGDLAAILSQVNSDFLFKGDALPARPDEDTESDIPSYEMALIGFCDLYFWCDGIGWIKYDTGNSSTQSLCVELSAFPAHDTSALFVYIDGTGTAGCGMYKKSTRGWIKF